MGHHKEMVPMETQERNVIKRPGPPLTGFEVVDLRVATVRTAGRVSRLPVSGAGRAALEAALALQKTVEVSA